MGIPFLFAYLRKKYPYLISKATTQRCVDNLCIDLNGVIHQSAQKVYQYGAFKPIKSLLVPSPKVNLAFKRCYVDVTKKIEEILSYVTPTKRLIICIDGTAGIAKQFQQRQRRFKSSLVLEEDSFDPNSITPGTVFMYNLSRYLDYYFKKQLTTGRWRGFEVIFSDEKVSGEGEHKLIIYLRDVSKSESVVIQGLDADLIMLSLGTQIKNFYILRDNEESYDIIDIGELRKVIVSTLYWGLEATEESLINDYIFLLFLLGNDFLPHSPSIEVLDGGLDTLIEGYKFATVQHQKSLVCTINDSYYFDKDVLKEIFKYLSTREDELIRERVGKVFSDLLLQPHLQDETLDEYKEEYYLTKFPPNTPKKNICHQYLTGMVWVLRYYLAGIPSWRWRYPYYYAPFALDMFNHLDSFSPPIFRYDTPVETFLQLISVLPMKSKKLIPEPLVTMLDTQFKEYFPDEFKIDLSNKKFEWQGIALIPMFNIRLLEDVYYKIKLQLSPQDLRRNILGKTRLYKHSSIGYPYKSCYGEFTSYAQVVNL